MSFLNLLQIVKKITVSKLNLLMYNIYGMNKHWTRLSIMMNFFTSLYVYTPNKII